ncbi:pyridoxal phosphate-dependent transferase [Fennellomyces sp. T-0311]|nr:pyridoxal phosphate-dependent transferase [Fennellomyces sp. T-0311]
MAASAKLAQFGKQHIAKGIGRSTELVLERAQGSYVWTVDGKNYSFMRVGHNHPTVVKAVQDQAANLAHGQVNLVFHKPMLDLIERLKPKMPSPELNTFFFTNSGAEAVENAIKLARHATNRQNIIVFQGSYHGRTFGTMALTTSKTVYSTGFGPLMPGVHIADKHNILLIADEVQSGFGRTGKMFAVEHSNVVPDIMIMAKGIASEIMDRQPAGSMGGTYSGNAVACAAAKATLDVFDQERLIRQLQCSGVTVDVRGLGFDDGIEFQGVPYGFAAKPLKLDTLLLNTSIYETIRLIPALTSPRKETDLAVDKVIAAIAAAFQG